MRIKLTLTLITLAGLIVFAGYVGGGNSAAAAALVDNRVNTDYRGASTFDLAGVAPNVARCGAFPENIELSFTGSGIDTEGGYNTAVFSACTNTATNRVFDLKAIDTYVQSGDQVFIEADSFVQVANPATCMATNEHAVPFRVAGGTGGHAGATGQGFFHITSNLTPCNGLTLPAHVSFQGVLIRQ
ncbi:MAG TPA: hypothetical protein VKB05_16505 [Pyrinomonadaceae bacterium]|nr:hypothetical protein [Pyrinomonadaceae bacterium]